MRQFLITALSLIRISQAAAALFEATDEWQILPEGYEISGGLHVRMDFETGEKLAKLPDPNAKDDDSQLHAVVWQDESDVPVVLKESDLLLQEASDQLDLGVYEKLEEVAEWAHDVEYGETIAKSPTFLAKLVNTFNDHSVPDQGRELAARVFGASFHNNDGALQQLFPGGEIVVDELLNLIHAEKQDGVQSRLVYALGSLVGNQYGYAAFVKYQGDEALRDVFVNASPVVQGKIAVLLEKVINESERVDENCKWSDSIQNVLTLIDMKHVTIEALPLLEVLVQIHEIAANKHDVPVSKDFLKWISAVTTSKGKVDESIYSLAKQARHRVFGNPNASRKDDL